MRHLRDIRDVTDGRTGRPSYRDAMTHLKRQVHDSSIHLYGKVFCNEMLNCLFDRVGSVQTAGGIGVPSVSLKGGASGRWISIFISAF